MHAHGLHLLALCVHCLSTRLSSKSKSVSVIHLSCKHYRSYKQSKMLWRLNSIEHLRGSSGARTQASYAHWTWDALKRWDAHRHAQQRRLEEMQVPCFYETNDPDTLRRQQRLLPLLLSAYHHV